MILKITTTRNETITINTSHITHIIRDDDDVSVHLTTGKVLRFCAQFVIDRNADTFTSIVTLATLELICM